MIKTAVLSASFYGNYEYILLIIVNTGTWEARFTKLLAFNDTSFARTIMFDNDATVLRHLDHLFLLTGLGKLWWNGAVTGPTRVRVRFANRMPMCICGFLPCGRFLYVSL